MGVLVDPAPVTDGPMRRKRHRHTQDRRPRKGRRLEGCGHESQSCWSPQLLGGRGGTLPRAFGGAQLWPRLDLRFLFRTFRKIRLLLFKTAQFVVFH